MLQRFWLAIPVALTILGSAAGVLARPATVFIPHLERIQSKLPSGLAMRLPSAIPLEGPSDIDESKLVVRLFPSDIPQRFTVGIFTCEASAHPCLIGSFSVEPKTNVSAKRELERHQAKGDRIPLVKNLEGYLIEGMRHNPLSTFSTMMWQQDDMIYTISFPAMERETIKSMAVSMAEGKPFYRVGDGSVSPP